MEASILIVSRNRKEDLRKTLGELLPFISKEEHEILVYLDNSQDSSILLKEEFPQVQWYGQDITVGASKARKYLYSYALGKILIGFDDDANPIHPDFIQKTFDIFNQYPQTGLIAYREFKGTDIRIKPSEEEKDYLTKDFMGCGFAVRKDVYDKTRGFPEWIDIYGEESCLALETLDLGYDILFTYQIAVHHRVNKIDRQNTGANYFRFERQLKNTSFFYLVYYPFPLVLHKLVKLHYHNFRKYAMTDKQFFQAYWSALWQVLKFFPEVIQYRKPVSLELLHKIRSLRNPEYHSNISGK